MRLVSAQEDERRRIARDVHDQLGQQMTAVRINLEGLLQEPISTRRMPSHSNVRSVWPRNWTTASTI